MSAASPLIENVSDTARWVAFHRALESERPDALFRDPFARSLAGERGRAIALGMPPLPLAHPGPRGLTWGLTVRTKVFDELILESIAHNRADAVLNLAAGLDARPYRLPLPSSLVWIEADRAAILDEKARALASETPSCVVERSAVDLAQESERRLLFERVAAAHTRVVVVSEGLLVYLDEALVCRLAHELRAQRAMCSWVVESVAPEVLEQNMRAWRGVLAAAGAEWKFAPASGFDFFRACGWSPAVTRSCVSEARRLGRDDMRYAFLLRALSALSARFRHKLERAVVYGVLQPSSS